MSRINQYSLVKVTCKKWLENENDPNDDEYELPILKYNVNQEAQVEHTEGTTMEEEEGTPMEEEKESITPS